MLPDDKIEVGVDWFTTWTDSTDQGQDIFNRFWVIGDELGGKKNLDTWNWRGFGGFQFHGIRAGMTRRGETLVMLSGSVANEYWKEFFEITKQCSRLDIQVTTSTNPNSFQTIEFYWQTLKLKQVIDPGRRKVSFVSSVGPRGGETLYLGSRSSEVYLRLYDKGAEIDGNRDKLWRYEIELKGRKSQATAELLQGSDTPYRTIEGLVWSEFTNRGVRPIWESNLYIKLPKIEQEDDLEKKLLWLERNVRPAVRKLLEVGLGDRVAEALGIKNAISGETHTLIKLD